MAIEIVDFPMKHGGSFHSFLYVYQRVCQHATIRFKRRVASFVTFQHVSQRVESLFVWQAQYFSVRVEVFVAGPTLYTLHSTLYTVHSTLYT